MRRSRLALTAVPLLVLATACGGGGTSQSSSPGSSTSPSPATSSTAPVATGNLDDINVALSKGAAFKATFQAPFSVSSTQVKVLDQGRGPTVSAGQTVLADYVAYNGTTAAVFDDSFRRGAPQLFALVDQQMLPGIITGLSGQKVGSTVLMAIPPAEGFGTQGAQQAGILPNDTMIFVMRIEQVSDPDPLRIASGKPSPLPGTVPDLKLDANGQPTTFTSTGKEIKSPTKLGVYTTIQGSGPAVKKGDLVTLQYVGQIYPDGTVFDDSWPSGARTVRIGANTLIKAWDVGLVGKRVGSRVVLVVPPDFGYGKKGNPQINVTGTDRLIFAIDILGLGLR